jgi:hypothetical protein
MEPTLTEKDGYIPLKGSDGSYLYLSIAGRSESHYLIESNREKCRVTFSKREWRDGELVDGYIALHIVLEASLNSLFRELALRSLKKEIDEIVVMENVDRISFIDKATLFIYNSKFNLDGKLADAARYHAVIGKLRAFCEIRNLLLHGHAIATVTNSKGTTRHTRARRSIDYQRLLQQINDFRFIVEGLAFFLDCLDGISEGEKSRFKSQYLSSDFLPDDIK